MIKIIGVILIVAGCTGMGFSFGGDLKERLTSLKLLRRMALLLRSEIKYRNTVLAEAFYHVAGNMGGACGRFLENVHKALEEKSGRGFAEIWEAAVDCELSGEALCAKDILILKELGGQLGFLDREMQLTTLDLYLEQVGQEIAAAEAGIREKVRIYGCLGVMGGLFLAIILL